MKIGIIGLGLIGGSLFKDLSEAYDVVAVSQSQSGDKIFKTYDVLKDRDIVFVCTAMNKALKVLDELEGILKPETIVTDVCSLKQFVCEKQRPYNFIPSHPMAGTEHKGFEHSFKGLFKGAKWVLIKNPTFSQSLLQGVEELCKIIRYVGAKPVFATAEEHDRAVAMISHMPMVLAQALMLSAKANPLAIEIASSGFRDMTRLALSNEEMACDMVAMNNKNIEQAILQLYKSIGELLTDKYPQTIAEIKEIRANMYQ